MFYQDSSSKVQEQAPHSPYDQRVYKRAVKSALRIPVLPDSDLGGHLPGNSRRQRIGGKDQDDRINIIGRAVIAVALISDDRRQGRPVEKPDDADHDRRDRQDSRLHRNTPSRNRSLTVLFYLFLIVHFPGSFYKTVCD